MNVAQVCRLALFNCDAVLINSTTHRMYTLPELLSWANQGKEQIETMLRQARADYQTLLLRSDDTDFRFNGFAFDVSTLQLTGTTSNYRDLPPDFIALKSIRMLTSGFTDIEWRQVDMGDSLFVQTRGDTNPQRRTILFDIVGERTLFIANPPSETLDFEIVYLAKSPRLRTYTTGTVTITVDTNILTGSSTAWIDNEVFPTMQNAEIIFGTSGSATVPAVVSQTSTDPFVDPNAIYQPIAAFTTNTAGTLAGNRLGTTIAAGTGYMIASRVEFPEEHIHALADYVAHRCMVKAKNWAAADKFLGYWEAYMSKFKADIQQRQFVDIEYVEDAEFED